MKDYELQIRVRNNYLLTAMQQNGYFLVSELARDAGVPMATIYAYLNFKLSAVTKLGEIREPVQRLADLLKRHPAQLFPPRHFDEPLKNNKATIKVDLAEMEHLFIEDVVAHPLLPDAQVEAADLRRVMWECLSELPERERRVLELRHGLNDEEPLILDDVSKRLFEEGLTDHVLTRTRIQQYEERAMRRLQHPAQAKRLKGVLA